MCMPAISDALDDAENIWGQSDEVTTREWSKLEEDFNTAGYREGITAGKESALQEGFDDGFDNVGAPLGREIGILRGVASAVLDLLSSAGTRPKGQPKDSERMREETRTLIQDLGRIHLEHLAPRDLQAEEHAREHLEIGAFGDMRVQMDQDINGTNSPRYLEPSNGRTPMPRAALQELRRIRVRLSELLDELGLDIALE